MTYTNSPLVDYKKLSPNHSGLRNHAIDTVSIHCVVGQCSVESLGARFADSSVGASSNYGIGYDGKIGLYVEEKNRSWCTSSASNDNRAITIEVASDTYHPYAVTDKAYNALIELLADICKRNGIKKLLWKADKSLIGQVSKQNMTVHCWFANKSCPGEYLYSRHSAIADAVNKKLGASTTKPATPAKPTTKNTNVDVTYRVKAGGKWLGEIKNLTDYAGIEGKPITDVAIKVNKGKIKYRVHVCSGGWLGWITKYDITDYHNGYAGNGKPIDAIQVYYYTPDDIRPYKKAYYKVSPIGKTSYYAWQTDTDKGGDMDGYAGSIGTKIDKLQIQIK